MSKHTTREDRTCKNCRHVVEKRYCSNCGQENVETRQSFTHLVAHFAEDLTHYDNAFWKTIQTLLFRPGRLTSEFIAGKRHTFVPPVKLYIFISFLTFFLLSAMSTRETNDDVITFNSKNDDTGKLSTDYASLKEFDSIHKSKPAADNIEKLERYFTRKLVALGDKYSTEEFKELLMQSVTNNIPKVLFLYLPISALSLWIFHGKKRWFYFDHGIFTLHYFAFILLTLSGYLVIQSLTRVMHIFEEIKPFLTFIMLGWWFFYFFRSHRRFYGESKLVSRTKSFALFFINLFFIIAFMIGLFIYSMVNIH